MIHIYNKKSIKHFSVQNASTLMEFNVKFCIQKRRDGSNRRAESKRERKINEWVTARCSDLSSHTFTVSIAPDENKEIKLFLYSADFLIAFLRLIIVKMLRKWILNSLIYTYFFFLCTFVIGRIVCEHAKVLSTLFFLSLN